MKKEPLNNINSQVNFIANHIYEEIIKTVAMNKSKRGQLHLSDWQHYQSAI